MQKEKGEKKCERGMRSKQEGGKSVQKEREKKGGGRRERKSVQKERERKREEEGEKMVKRKRDC